MSNAVATAAATINATTYVTIHVRHFVVLSIYSYTFLFTKDDNYYNMQTHTMKKQLK